MSSKSMICKDNKLYCINNVYGLDVFDLRNINKLLYKIEYLEMRGKGVTSLSIHNDNIILGDYLVLNYRNYSGTPV